MNIFVKQRLDKVRETDLGQRLTVSQIDEALNLCHILASEIQHSGSFRGKLTEVSRVYACNRPFDALGAERILREMFKIRYGKTLNEMRETLMERQDALKEEMVQDAIERARRIPEIIRTTPGLPFYRVFDDAAVTMSDEFDVTEAAAKQILKEAFTQSEGKDLYEAGKEAEKANREKKHEQGSSREQKNTRSPSKRGRDGPRR